MEAMEEQKNIEFTAQCFYFIKPMIDQLHKKVVEADSAKEPDDHKADGMKLTKLAASFNQQVVEKSLSSLWFVNNTDRRSCHDCSASVLYK